MADLTLAERITEYLSSGGLFNPELANHDAVRDLLIDCRSALTASAPAGTREAVVPKSVDSMMGITLGENWSPDLVADWLDQAAQSVQITDRYANNLRVCAKRLRDLYFSYDDLRAAPPAVEASIREQVEALRDKVADNLAVHEPTRSAQTGEVLAHDGNKRWMEGEKHAYNMVLALLRNTRARAAPPAVEAREPATHSNED